VLTVVQHQQYRARTEEVDDAGENIRRDGEATDRGAPRLTDAEHRCDLADDVVITGDTGERDQVHDPLLRLTAHDIREPCLTQAAGADDRRDTGRAQQIRYRGEVIGATEQRVGLMRDTVPNRGRLTL
jgi:hypothetical protein